MESTILYKPIGIIRTPYKDITEMPVQPCGALDVEGVIEIYPEYTAGLIDLEGFSHIILLYHFHLIKGYKLYVVPFMDDKPHGIFATRYPCRPNPLGLSVVQLIERKENLLCFKGADMLDGTPLLDIKPYIPEFDIFTVEKIGWYQNRKHR